MNATSHKLKNFALLGVLAVTVSACATSPLGRKQLKLFSDAQLAEMGAASYAQLKQQTPASSNRGVNSYVQCVANNVVAVVGGNWEVTVFEDEAANAFALPGGKIGVFTGLLKPAQNQDQLAAVIGHEIAHVLAGHSNERVSSQAVTEMGTAVVSGVSGVDPQLVGLAAQTFFLLPYSRAHETEADLLGLDIMAKAGFDPRQSVDLWVNMASASGGQAPPEFMSTHPSNETRINGLQNRLKVAMPIYEKARQQGKNPRCG